MRKSIETQEEYVQFKKLALLESLGHNRHEIVNFHSTYIAHGKICMTCNEAQWQALLNIKAHWANQKDALAEKFEPKPKKNAKGETA